ncbi:MAG: tetratricopeptide repeat protein [Paenibacillus sp.]|nr:tetratricopeptide repeat protein [Paenibacillus sp.]
MNHADYEGAILLFQQVVKSYPDRATPYFFIANSLAELNRHEEAIEYYNKAINIIPNIDFIFNKWLY